MSYYNEEINWTAIGWPHIPYGEIMAYSDWIRHYETIRLVDALMRLP